MAKSSSNISVNFNVSRRLAVVIGIAAGLLLSFIAGYILAMQLVAHNVSAPFAPDQITPTVPGEGCLPGKPGLYACPMIPTN